MTTRLLTIWAALVLGTTPLQAGDAATGEALYGDVCAACHGPSGRGMASYPRVSGKEVDYLTDRLNTYRAGERVGPNSMLMIPMAADLSDADIANLAAYLSGA